MNNRIISLDELLAMPDGTNVWVEERESTGFPSVTNHIVTLWDGDRGLFTQDESGFYSLVDPWKGAEIG